MLRGITMGLLLCLGATLSAQTINITGKVTNKTSGKAISGATITLVSKKLTTTTNAEGSFTISGTAIAPTQTALPTVEKITLNNGLISIALPDAAPLKVDFFNLQGNLLEQVVNRQTTAGEYRFNLAGSRFAATMMVIRVATGRSSSTFRYLPLSSGKQVLESIPSSTSKHYLAKVQATVDSVRVTAANYSPVTVGISSFETQVNVTLDTIALAKFSFFITSLKALQDLSGSTNGFGGNFSFGKTGQGAGLLGADSICQCIAERSMPGSKVKKWRAFLSVAKGPAGTPVNAIDRIGSGPWYDRVGRLVSNNLTELKNTRPAGADPAIKNDLPNEDGIPNHYPNGDGKAVDNHHMVTGSTTTGTLYTKTDGTAPTCNDWTSTTASGQPRCGFAWPRGGMAKSEQTASGSSSSHWISGFDAGGCVAGIHITTDMGGGNIIGANGGYGGFYCFALTP
jgi:hypothetical protein